MAPRPENAAKFEEEEGPGVEHKQKHLDENEQLIADGLACFEEELQRLPPKERQYVDQALEHAPTLATDDKFRLTFLRTEVFKADLAAKRFAKFWETRIDLFGPEKAFEPITQQHTLKDDMATLRKGYIRTVPGQERVLVIDPARTLENYDIESIARSTRYVMEKATFACQDMSRLGSICIVDFGTIRWFDRKLVKRLSHVTENCIPLRTTKILIINPPSRMVKYFVNLLKLCIKQKMRNRIHVVSNSEKLKRLAGVTLEEMAALDHETWLEQMAQQEQAQSDEWMM